MPPFEFAGTDEPYEFKLTRYGGFVTLFPRPKTEPDLRIWNEDEQRYVPLWGDRYMPRGARWPVEGGGELVSMSELGELTMRLGPHIVEMSREELLELYPGDRTNPGRVYDNERTLEQKKRDIERLGEDIVEGIARDPGDWSGLRYWLDHPEPVYSTRIYDGALAPPPRTTCYYCASPVSEGRCTACEQRQP